MVGQADLDHFNNFASITNQNDTLNVIENCPCLKSRLVLQLMLKHSLHLLNIEQFKVSFCCYQSDLIFIGAFQELNVTYLVRELEKPVSMLIDLPFHEVVKLENLRALLIRIVY